MGSSTSSPFTATITGLTENTTYYCKAYVGEWNENTNKYEYRYGPVKSFTTLSTSTGNNLGYLANYEVPDVSSLLNGQRTSGTYSPKEDKWYRYYTTNSSRQIAMHTYNQTRTYVVLYDETKYAPLWSAHAMNDGMWPNNSVGRNQSWCDDPAISLTQQSGLDNANSVGYSRGHFVASSDRQTHLYQNKQTFYYSNQAPQWQNGFNGNIWSKLEDQIQDLVPAAGSRDTLYVVTGVLYENNKTLPSGSLDVPIPSHFYKCLMLCSFNASGTMTGAQGCAYIFTNEYHTENSYDKLKNFAAKIDDIETLAGFDFFPRVPANLQTTAENSKAELW
ncbi:MAG: DNA/RNA non-specific endonuclease [Bacteroidales bacterium]|nr:DNA/RNA non-specific endonuclease [Bacteroidales bacterium]